MLYRCGQSRLARQLAPYGIGKGQVAFLMRLYHTDGIHQDALAASLYMDKGTTARALDHLEHSGYVERRRDDDDGRVNRVYLTAKAHQIRPQLRQVLATWNQTLFAGFSAEERAAVMAALRRMAGNATDAMNLDRNGGTD